MVRVFGFDIWVVSGLVCRAVEFCVFCFLGFPCPGLVWIVCCLFWLAWIYVGFLRLVVWCFGVSSCVDLGLMIFAF